jgi:hypothetical protein
MTLITTPTVDGADGTQTEHFHMSRTVHHISGAIQLPAGSSNGDAIIGRLHAPIEVVVVEYSAMKIGSPPVVPGPFEPGAVLITSSRKANGSKLDPESGLYHFTVAGSYTFGVKKAGAPGGPLKAGREPYQTRAQAPIEIPGVAFSSGCYDAHETWTLELTGTPTGTLTLRCDHEEAVLTPASATYIQAALEALSGVGVGGVSVTGDAPTFTITFTVEHGLAIAESDLDGGTAELLPVE